MKNKLSSIIALAALCVLGCAGSPLFESRQTVTPVVTTNAVGQISTNYLTNVVQIPSPVVTGALKTAQEISGWLPPPWNNIATGVLGLATVVFGAIARAKSKRAALVPTLILGIEKAAANQAVKTAVKEVAEAAGVQSQLHAVVQQLTEK